ncbi:MAG TPA: bifunctional aspartate kinase/homoserine dehydrogenase I [Bacteroidia bacterium]|nr:bifunctional aspartate kinase/homoserine dehydrogenase I [Bacteroidia bacterium]
MLVQKYGGTSVANAQRIAHVARIISGYRKKNPDLMVVVSAFSGVTDALISASAIAANHNESYPEILSEIYFKHREAVRKLIPARQRKRTDTQLRDNFRKIHDTLHGVFLVRELSPRTLDYIISFGERCSAFIIAEHLKSKRIPAHFVDARLLVKTDDSFGEAKPDMNVTRKNIREYFSKLRGVKVVTGFIGATMNDETTTLGRGGSDFTAAIFGAALGAKEIEIWTDVDGVMTADPRKVKKAFSIPSLSYEEAMEMSHFGAKIIYPPTIQPAYERSIPLRIKNTFNPMFPGTLIHRKRTHSDFPVRGISSIDDIALLSLQGSGIVGVAGISARLFGALASVKINVMLITQGSSEHIISFAVRPQDAVLAQMVIDSEFKLETAAGMIEPVKRERELSIVAVIGENMKNTPGISGRLFGALGKNGISVIATAQGSSELNISIVIKKKDEAKAINALHQAFFLSDIKTCHLFLAGTGLIGKELIRQMLKQSSHLMRNQRLEFVLAGICNSRTMQLSSEGMQMSDALKNLSRSKQKATIKDFAQNMIRMNLPNSIFVDCSASSEVADCYEEIINQSISVVTPNKTANSRDFRSYLRLQEVAARRNVQFLYETNVGAGLPVISTLNDLLVSGDRIIRIEAVLSGTLSFIFNTFSAEKKFSVAVKEAMKRGYTEPDPRIDLSGKDVARKLLILARECGMYVSMSDVQIAPLLPAQLRNAKSVNEFLKLLPSFDSHFEKMRQHAVAAGKKLRFIASLKSGKLNVELITVDSLHPFYNLTGSDNIISFTTERYRERPLVIRGPGAGAEVTAAGVFAEIIGLGSYLS